MSGEGLSQRGAEFQLQPVPASKRKRSAVQHERPRIWPAPSSSTIQATTVTTTRPARLRRAQSLPNMRAKHCLEPALEASHSIIIPTRLNSVALPSTRTWQMVSQAMERNGMVTTTVTTMPKAMPSVIASSSSSPALVRMMDPASPLASASQQAQAVFTPSLLPPINSQTLKELDLHEILKNPQLRHDLVFDADLQFRPNFDGERGRRKRDVCNKYWRAIQREIQSQCACTSFYGGTELPCICASIRRRGSGVDRQQPSHPRFLARLPDLIAELRCICLSILPSQSARMASSGAAAVAASAPARSNDASFAARQREAMVQRNRTTQTLTPNSARTPSTSTPSSPWSAAMPSVSSMVHMSDEHAVIMQCLDPALIMQQLYHGGLDIAGLIVTVGTILKQHCAPMRDAMIDAMIATVTEQNDVTRSLRQCFEILELMKLDVANHQLSTSRVCLVETAPDFEARWFRDQVCRGRIQVQRTVQWFTGAMEQHGQAKVATTDGQPSSKTIAIMEAFDGGVLDLIFDPPTTTALRPTLNGAPSPTSRLPFCNAAASSIMTSIGYPETFQFDTCRLLTFHGEVTDITVVSMLLLLFRQLTCSPQKLTTTPLPFEDQAKPTTASISALASSQLEAVKGEIWTLLREAEVERISTTQDGPSAGVVPPPTPGGVASRVLDNRLSSWRKVVGDIVLQIAARAIRVQVEARYQLHRADGSDAGKATATLAPSSDTSALLTRWLETNLQSTSPLFKLCRSRVRTLLARLTATPVQASGSSASPSSSSAAPSINRKRTAGDLNPPSSAKRARFAGMASPHTPSTPHSAAFLRTAVPIVTDAGDLAPFAAEMAILAERVRRVKAFHLRVYRDIYEPIAASICRNQEQQRTAALAVDTAAPSTSSVVEASTGQRITTDQGPQEA